VVSRPHREPSIPPEQEPAGFDRLAYEHLTETDVERILQNVTAEPGLGAADSEEEFRISIAGAQEKTALLRIGKQWLRPHDATPTTHILKLPLGIVGGRQLDLSHSVENEWLCAQILAALGLPVAETEMAIFGQQKALVVERFDRAWMDEGKWIARLPQEDFCQMLGYPSDKKYEFNEIQVSHWHALATTRGVDEAWKAMLAMVSRVDEALTVVAAQLPASFPAHVAETIFNGVRAQRDAFIAGAAAL